MWVLAPRAPILAIHNRLPSRWRRPTDRDEHAVLAEAWHGQRITARKLWLAAQTRLPPLALLGVAWAPPGPGSETAAQRSVLASAHGVGLDTRIVPAIPLPAHARDHVRRGETVLVILGRILATAVRMGQEPRDRSLLQLGFKVQ